MTVTRPTWIRVAITVVACAVACFAQRHVAHYSCCDASSYVDQALDFQHNGLFGSSHKFMSLRTYGYPFFVSLVSTFTDEASVEWCVFGAQLLLLLVCARTIAGIFAARLKLGSTALYAVIVLNPLLLVAAPAVLTDLLATLCATLAVALVLHRDGHRLHIAAASLFLAGCAAMVRPASVVFVPMVLVFWLVRGRYLRWPTLLAWPVMAISAVVPFVPQVINNHRLFGRWTPLIVENLYAQQKIWGMQYLKYQTLIPAAPLPYLNPWYNPKFHSFAHWLRVEPLRAGATVVLHVFGIFDQDFAFTYVHDIHPWYRWPLCAAGFAYLVIAAAAIASLVRRMIARRRIGPSGYVVLVLVSACAGYLSLYLPTAVEPRFAAPVYVLLSPLVVIGLRAYARMLRHDRRRAVVASVIAVAVVGCCLWISYWLSQQAPGLVAG